MKPRLPTEMKEGFSRRLIEVLDSKGFPKAGRVSRLSEKFGVTPSAAGAWLKGSIPSVDMVLSICSEFGCKPNWLLTGKDDASFELDAPRLIAAVKNVNHSARKQKLFDSLSDDKLARLYLLVYGRLAEGQLSQTEIDSQVNLAAPSDEE